MQILQVSKVYANGKVSLGEVLEEIGADVGGYVQFTREGDRICIDRVGPKGDSE